MRQLCSFIAIAMIASSSRAAATILNLGAFNSAGTSSASAISADGLVVIGTSSTANGDRAFKWSLQSGLENLGSLNNNFSSTALGTNSNGSVVVGSSVVSNQFTAHGFLWKTASGMSDLDTLGGTYPSSQAFATSGNGEIVVGTSSSYSGTTAFRWDSVNGMQSIGSPVSTARGISADGQIIVGETNGQAYRWTESIGMQLLTMPSGFSNGRANNISGDGQFIVGDTGATNTRAFRWSAQTGSQILGLLPGGDYSQAYGVSSNGSIIVGQASSFSGASTFLWTAELGMMDLHSYLSGVGIDMSHWSHLTSVSISANGMNLAGSGLFDGQLRAFYVEGLSIPSPASATLLGVSGLLFRRRRS
jgi:probable HAF family extracellular repeat protein